MKIKSYHILFRIFSYLSDKTNGAPLFVKYKLLLGTLILGVTTSLANSGSKAKMVNDTVMPNKPEENIVTCYDTTAVVVTPTISSEKIEVKGKVQDESGEPIVGATVMIKGTTTGTVADTVGFFNLKAPQNGMLVFSYIGMETKEVLVSEIIKKNKPIVMKGSRNILCYEVVVSCYITATRKYTDDIYNNAPKIITKMSCNEIQVRPISPVGNLDNFDFQNWMDQQIRYNERMLKDKVEGNVILRFAIDKNGKIVNAKVIQKLSPDADAEALRVLTSSGKWTPGRQNDKAIKTTMIRVTVHFKLPEE